MLKSIIQNDSETAEAVAFALSLSLENVEACMAINNTLAATQAQPIDQKGTMAFYACHYANPAYKYSDGTIGSYGINGLVREILDEHGAIFIRNIQDTDARPVAVQGSLYTHEIIERSKPKFAAAKLRYQPQAVANELSTYGTDHIGKIKLTTSEDKPRSSTKCRCKWYLIKQAK